MNNFLLTAGVGACLCFCGWIYLRFVVKPDNGISTIKDIWEEQAFQDYMDIIFMITGALTPEYLDKVKTKIENFENHYSNLIPLKVVHQYVINMYGLADERAKELTSSVRVK